MHQRGRTLRSSLLFLLAAAGCAPPPSADSGVSTGGRKPEFPQKIDAPHLPNAWRLHARVFSGGQPDGEAAFRELQALGVKTVISVDGARPDVDLARRHGMRYVHLPHGYDGIPEERAQELARAVRDLPGLVYIHCHHGKHRSPAAATVACVSVGLLNPGDAVAVLKRAGTSENYHGLYEAAESARRIDDGLLDALQPDFRETIELPPMAEAMVQIEHVYDHLKSMSKAGWKPPANHLDLVPAHEALLLKELSTELLRTPEVRQKPERFRRILGEMETAARELETLLLDKSADEDSLLTGAGKSFDRVTSTCTTCHREFRDVPLSRKKPE